MAGSGPSGAGEPPETGPSPESAGDGWAVALREQGADGRGGSGASLAEEWGAAMAEQGGAGTKPDLAAEWAAMIEDEAGATRTDAEAAERILSQPEIDAVLGFTPHERSASGAGGVRAIVESGAVQYERLPMLEVVFDRLVRLAATSLRKFFGDNVDVRLEAITPVRFGDYLDGIALPALIGVFRAEAWESSGLVTVEQALTFASLDLLLGGRRGAAARLEGRPFTGIETSLVRRLVEIVLADLERAFQPLSPVAFRLERVEPEPRLATIIRPTEAAILADLVLDIDGRGGRMQVLFPYAAIEPIRELLTQSFVGERLARDPAWESHLATELWQASVSMEAVLHETRMPLRRVLGLKVGDTLVFEQRAGDPVTVRCGDWVLTQGRVGRIDDAIAVQVTRSLRASRTTLAAFEAASAHRSDG